MKTDANLTECRRDALGAERKAAQAAAASIGKGVGDGGGHRPLRGFAGAERLFVGRSISATSTSGTSAMVRIG